MPLPINVDEVLRGRVVERERLELKAGWNPEKVLHTLCAFANDFHNLGGGYLFIGVEERDGRPVLPPVGLAPSELDRIIERTFTGPLGRQLRDALGYLRNAVVQEEVRKHADRAEADRFFNYPYAAIEEALVNAVYHRGYEEREPIEVRVLPDHLTITGYPGPGRPRRGVRRRRGQDQPRRHPPAARARERAQPVRRPAANGGILAPPSPLPRPGNTVHADFCMEASMRTTLDLNDALLRRARTEAARQRTTLTRLIEEGLALRLEQGAAPAEPRPPFQWKVFEGRGEKLDHAAYLERLAAEDERWARRQAGLDPFPDADE